MLNKFLKGFFMLSTRQKLRFLNGGCDTCLTKERSMPVRTGEHVPSLMGYVGETVHRSSIYVGYRERKPILAHGGK